MFVTFLSLMCMQTYEHDTIVCTTGKILFVQNLFTESHPNKPELFSCGFIKIIFKTETNHLLDDAVDLI